MKNEKQLLLFIEDNPLLTDLYEAAFKKQGVRVMTAHEGERGLKLAKENKPDLIVLDLLMHGMDGFEVLNKLKTDPKTKKIKVVMLTVDNEEQNKIIAKTIGAYDYLIKSELKIEDVVERVMKHL